MKKQIIAVLLAVLVCWYEVDVYVENGEELEIMNVYCDQYDGEVFLMKEPKNDE